MMKRKDITREAVLEAVDKIDFSQRPTRNVFDHLSDQYPDAPFKVLLRAVERENDNGNLDYGASINYPFRRL